MAMRYGLRSTIDESLDFFSSDAQNFMAKGCGIMAHLVGFSSFPLVVQVTQLLVDTQVVEGNVANNLLFKGACISVVVDAVFETQSFELFISIKTVRNLLGNLFSKVLDQLGESLDIGD